MTTKMIQLKNGSLTKEKAGTTIGFEKGANLGITIMTDTSFKTAQLDDRDVNELAYWLAKNYDLSLCPGFKEAIEYKEAQEKIENFRKILEDNADRLSELGMMIRRLKGLLESIIEVDGIKQGALSDVAIRQINSAIEDCENLFA